MIVLLDAAGASVTFAAVWLVWQARRAWAYGQPAARRATLTGTVARPIPSPRPPAGRPAPAILAGRVIRGELPRGKESR